MRQLTTSLVLVALLALTGCGGGTDTKDKDKDKGTKDVTVNPHEKLMTDLIASIGELNTILEGIKDEATAKAAVDKINAVAGKLKAIGERHTKLGDSDEATTKAIQTKYETPFTDAVITMANHNLRLSADPAIAKHVGEPLKNVDAAMAK